MLTVRMPKKDIPTKDSEFTISGPDIFGIMTIWSSNVVVSKLNLTTQEPPKEETKES